MSNRRANAMRRWIRMVPRGAVLIGLLLFLSTCADPAPPPLRVGLLVWPGYEMGFLARELGHFDGQAIELVEFHSPAITMRAYNSGAVDVVALTTHYLLQLAAREPQQRAILITNVSNGADAVLARPDIASLSDLAGRRIGVERSALGAYMLQRLLDKAGLTKADIQIVSVDIAEGPEFYEQNLIDAVITYEPYGTQIRKLGANTLLSSRDLPQEIMDVLITEKDVVESRPEPLAALVHGWLRAVDRFIEAPDRYAPQLARRENLSTEEFLTALADVELADRAFNEQLLGTDRAPMAERLASTAEVLRRAGFLDVPLDYKALVEPRFIAGGVAP